MLVLLSSILALSFIAETFTVTFNIPDLFTHAVPGSKTLTFSVMLLHVLFHIVEFGDIG